jgi:hypothetical protein
MIRRKRKNPEKEARIKKLYMNLYRSSSYFSTIFAYQVSNETIKDLTSPSAPCGFPA